MDHDHLQIVAEVGVAIVGFSGIVALFATNLRLKSGGINQLRFVDLLLSGFGAVFLSFTPGLFGYFGLSEVSIWHWSEVVMTCWFLGTLVVLFSIGRTNKPEAKWHFVFPVVAVILTLTLIASISGLVTFSPGALHFVGLLWLLGISSIEFSLLLLKAIYDT